MRMLSGLVLALIATSPPVSAQERPGTPGVIMKGSDNVSIGGKPAARQGDTTSGGNVVVEGSKNVFINGKPAAVTNDKTSCGGVVIGGGGNLFMNGKPAARSGDQTSGCPR